MRRVAGVVFIVCLTVSSLLAQRTRPTFGDPLPGLSEEQLEAFENGLEEFAETETVADGLGPVFNEASCAACHIGPTGAIGGSNDRLETRFGYVGDDDVFDPMTYAGGSLLQDHAIGSVGDYMYVREEIPYDANRVAGRRTTPLFGLGLVDAISGDDLLRIAAIQATSPDRIGGRANIVIDPTTRQPAVGRFGWKAQVPSLFVFSGDAYLNEMGITNPIFPDENCPQGDCSRLADNPAPGLNDDGSGVQAFTAFMQLLAPPPRAAITTDAAAGAGVFAQMGCGSCHLPTMRTASSPIRALDRVTFHPFSDFLVHDMGSLGDGIAQGGVGPTEMRTAPLWGLSVATSLLHDGRTSSLEEAIAAHDGQGAPSRDRFAALSATRRAQLIAFLRSL
jgi:CxxC motif-containing protein (DUF1111 family)